MIVEIWSRTTGSFDVNAKIPEYQWRGDLETWRNYPIDRTVTKWRRQSDGSCEETTQTGGTVQLHAHPDVTIDLDKLFE